MTEVDESQQREVVNTVARYYVISGRVSEGLAIVDKVKAMKTSHEMTLNAVTVRPFVSPKGYREWVRKEREVVQEIF